MPRGFASGVPRSPAGFYDLPGVLLEERPFELGRALVARAREDVRAHAAGPAVAHAGERAQLDLTARRAVVVGDAGAVVDGARGGRHRTAIVRGPRCGGVGIAALRD